MDLSQKYHLIELLPGEGVQSYRARQTNTGREVTVHLLVGGKTPENEATLVRLRAMQPQSMTKLIEVGEQQGTTFVVTVAPPFQRLDAWLAEQDRVAAVAKEFGKATVWKRPAVGSLLPPAPPPPPVRPAATPSTEPGAFTRMFQSPVAPPPAEPVVPPASAATRQFTPPPPPAPLRPAATPSTEPGAFTRMFHSPMPDAPAQGDWPPAAAKPPEPGAFTRMFQAPGPALPHAGTTSPETGPAPPK